MAKKYKANYNTANPTYLDYLLALRKVFTNDTDIIPIIYEFNFYINGVFSTPYVDLFRMYDENIEDIHGAEKTKQLIDDGSIGVINTEIYKSNGSLLASLESLRVYLLDRSNKYTIAYNPFTNQYTEVKKMPVNTLPEANPNVTNNGIAVDEKRDLPALGLTTTKTTTKKRKSFWAYLSFLSHPKNKKAKVETETEKRIRSTGEYYKNLNN
jgi:hypothetical protein